MIALTIIDRLFVLVLLLPVWFGLDGVLYFMAAADAVTFIVTVPVLVRTDRALRG